MPGAQLPVPFRVVLAGEVHAGSHRAVADMRGAAPAVHAVGLGVGVLGGELYSKLIEKSDRLFFAPLPDRRIVLRPGGVCRSNSVLPTACRKDAY